MIAQSQWETLFGVAATSLNGAFLAFWQRGDIVWRKADFPTPGPWANKNYTVIDIQTVSFNNGVERFADATLTTEVTNAGTPAAQPNDETTGWFYVIQHNTTGKIYRQVHESDLAGESGIETYITSLVGGFIA